MLILPQNIIITEFDPLLGHKLRADKKFELSSQQNLFNKEFRYTIK